MNKNWIKLTDRMPEPGKLVWVLRSWVPGNPAFGTEPRTEILAARRDGEKALVVNADPWGDCYWGTEGSPSLFSDVTVAGWQEIPALDDVIRACNSHGQLVAALRETLAEAVGRYEQIVGESPDESDWCLRARAALAAAEA